jgi:hypothetical protein
MGASEAEFSIFQQVTARFCSSFLISTPSHFKKVVRHQDHGRLCRQFLSHCLSADPLLQGH